MGGIEEIIYILVRCFFSNRVATEKNFKKKKNTENYWEEVYVSQRIGHSKTEQQRRKTSKQEMTISIDQQNVKQKAKSAGDNHYLLIWNDLRDNDSLVESCSASTVQLSLHANRIR